MDGKLAINPECISISDNICWFFSSKFNGLYSLNFDNEQVCYHGFVEKEKLTQERLFVSVCAYKNKVFLIPFFATGFYIYSIDEGCYYTYDAANCVISANSPHYMASISVKENLYVFGTMEPNILKINMDTLDVKCISRLDDDFNLTNTNGCFFRNQVQIVKDKILAPLCNTAAVLEIDTNSDDIKIIHIEDSEYGYNGICVDNDKKKIWLVPRRACDPIVCCNNNWKVIRKILTSSTATRTVIVGIEKIKDQVTFFSGDAKLFEVFSDEEVHIEKENYDFVLNRDGIVYFCKHDSSTLLVCDGESINSFELLTNGFYSPYPRIQECSATNETMGWGLSEFIKTIQ